MLAGECARPLTGASALNCRVFSELLLLYCECWEKGNERVGQLSIYAVILSDRINGTLIVPTGPGRKPRPNVHVDNTSTCASSCTSRISVSLPCTLHARARSSSDGMDRKSWSAPAFQESHAPSPSNPARRSNRASSSSDRYACPPGMRAHSIEYVLEVVELLKGLEQLTKSEDTHVQ